MAGGDIASNTENIRVGMGEERLNAQKVDEYSDKILGGKSACPVGRHCSEVGEHTCTA